MPMSKTEKKLLMWRDPGQMLKVCHHASRAVDCQVAERNLNSARAEVDEGRRKIEQMLRSKQRLLRLLDSDGDREQVLTATAARLEQLSTSIATPRGQTHTSRDKQHILKRVMRQPKYIGAYNEDPLNPLCFRDDVSSTDGDAIADETNTDVSGFKRGGRVGGENDVLMTALPAVRTGKGVNSLRRRHQQQRSAGMQ